MQLEHLGLIGNCQYSALIERSGDVAWCCMPRFDSEPLFSTLLDAEEGGRFTVSPAGGGSGMQRYLENSNVLETRFETGEGAFRVIDFAPRFMLHGRIFRPTQLYRLIEPIAGLPRVRVRCAPRLGWSKQTPTELWGSHHIRYEGFTAQLRLTTDLPLSYLDGRPFSLTERRRLVLTWGPPIEEPLEPLFDRFLSETLRHWQTWVKHCDVPPRYQHEVIRSALALKLHCFEDTGAIVAAMTTSIPESPGSGRTWDYRYCWLRDAYYVLGAFRLLGQFEEREQFTGFLLNLAGGAPDLKLAPLYRIDGGSELSESTLTNWPGYQGHGPVRVGNAAAQHLQHDIFGEMVLALTPAFLDERFAVDRSRSALALLEALARKAISVAGSPDAGIWEYRTAWQPQTFSSLMCWAAADRMAAVAARHQPAIAAEFAQAAARLHAEIIEHAWSESLRSFVGRPGSDELDAALLQMVSLRFLPWSDKRLHDTVQAIIRGLAPDGWMFRYLIDDGFGQPKVAFIICMFWLVEALVRLGRQREAEVVMEKARAAQSPLGLLSEDFETGEKRLWGNFPQAYSHVGLIHAAFATSPSWSEVL